MWKSGELRCIEGKVVAKGVGKRRIDSNPSTRAHVHQPKSFCSDDTLTPNSQYFTLAYSQFMAIATPVPLLPELVLSIAVAPGPRAFLCYDVESLRHNGAYNRNVRTREPPEPRCNMRYREVERNSSATFRTNASYSRHLLAIAVRVSLCNSASKCPHWSMSLELPSP